VKIIHTIEEMSNFSKKTHLKAQTIGFVPTMGALHEGHLSLIRQARKENDIVVVSIFVNPIQFGQKEDYRRYPRNLKLDAQACRKEDVDIIFCPDREEMYPANYKTYVTVRDLSDVLCGQFRPGHFQGVATVVAKLFHIINPDIAYFGQKDAQQSIIIKKMVEDLKFAVKIKIIPTIREKDGLALSSRNAYLHKGQRRDALVLYQALTLAKNLIRQGKIDSSEVIGKMKELINKKKSANIQYVAIVDPKDLLPVDKIRDKVLVALSVWIGKTRLIDNIIIDRKT